MTPELRDLLLHEAALSEPVPRGDYWYPLARPTYGGEEIVAALECLLARETTMGPRVERFEREFAHAISSHTATTMVSSGTSADLALMLAAVETGLLPKGSTVLVPAVTWPTHLWAVRLAGLRAHLVDVDPTSGNVTRRTLEIARQHAQGASGTFIMHLLGNPCPMFEIERFCDAHHAPLFEDCCESFGATYADRPIGSMAWGATYSFFFAHHLMTMEGGMVTTAPKLTDAVRLMRSHGWARAVPTDRRPLPPEGIDPRYHFLSLGLNLRPTELQAAFGLAQLARWDGLKRRRAEIATRVYMAITDRAYRQPHVLALAKPCWMALPFFSEEDRGSAERSRVQARLESLGVETRPIVAGNLARQPAVLKEHARGGINWGPLPGAEHVHRNGFYIGLSPVTSDADVERLIETLQEALPR